MRIKGMRDIPTAQSLINRSVPASRAQVVAYLARAEHEKARLEREQAMWLANQKQTEDRLRLVSERIELLRSLLDDLAPRPKKVVRRRPARSVPVRRREVSLEY